MVDAAGHCKTIMDRYFALLDNITYMKHEHIQKEKEYGITWRSAFKVELNRISTDLHSRVIAEDDAEDMEDDPFMVLHKIVRQDTIDASTFDSRCQADLLHMLVPQLELMELGIYTLKKLLKTPDFGQFADTIASVRATLKESHLAFNPDSETYKGDELAAREKREKYVKEAMDELKKTKIKKGITKD